MSQSIIKFNRSWVYRLLLVLCMSISMVGTANAALVKLDFQTAGDELLILDTATNLEWLSPLVTAGQSYNSVIGGFNSLVTTEGFSVAGAATVRSMFNTNFDNPTSTVTIDNFLKAQAFMNTFGVTEFANCSAATPPGACPRTQAWAVDGTTLTGLGMITFGGTHGQVIDFSGTVGSFGNITDGQRGVWLIRADTLTSVPIPSAMLLFGSGLAALGAWRQRKGMKS